MSLNLEKTELKKIIDDSIHGSSYLLKETVNLLGKKPLSVQLDYLKKIVASHRGMAYLVNLLKFVEETGRGCIEFYNEIKEAQREEMEKFVHQFQGLSVSVISTFSYSGLVRDALIALYEKKPFALYIGESRPANEGIKFAEHLYNSGVKSITVMSDACFFSKIERCDAVILGCDGFTDTFFVNKTGSRAIVQLADYHKKDVYVIADRYKRLKGDVDLKRGDGGEIYRGKLPLMVLNPYLERIDLLKNVIIFY